VFAPAAAVDPLVEDIHDRLTGMSAVAADASTLVDDAGVTVRVLGDRSADVTAAVEVAWDESHRHLLGVGAPLEGKR
jgi:urease accessory protein